MFRYISIFLVKGQTNPSISFVIEVVMIPRTAYKYQEPMKM